MKLQIQHILPYLPYELKVEDLTGNIEKVISITCAGFNQHLMTNLKGMTCTRTNIEHCKPLLKPIEDIKYIPEIMIQFSDYEWEEVELSFLSKLKPVNNLDSVKYSVLQLCFKHHLDLFDLIPNNLALNKNNYE